MQCRKGAYVEATFALSSEGQEVLARRTLQVREQGVERSRAGKSLTCGWGLLGS